MEFLWEIAGWAGTVAVLTGYLAVSMNWIGPGRIFHALNILGACGLIANGIYHHAWPSIATNLGWFLIGTVAILRGRTAISRPRITVDAPPVRFPGVSDTREPGVARNDSYPCDIGGGRVNEQ
ncbi:CBU_0592 family membrane protein [Paenarthrobacter nitroguajacolicus]